MRVGQILDGFMIVVTLRIAMFCCLDRENNNNGIHYKTTLPQLHIWLAYLREVVIVDSILLYIPYRDSMYNMIIGPGWPFYACIIDNRQKSI